MHNCTGQKKMGDIPEEMSTDQVQKHLVMQLVDKYKPQLRPMDFYLRRKGYMTLWLEQE